MDCQGYTALSRGKMTSNIVTQEKTCSLTFLITQYKRKKNYLLMKK